MTIRKRLFWSNILMLVIPALLSTLMAYFILFVFTRYSNDAMERAFPQAFQAMLRLGDEDLEGLYASVDDFNNALDGERVYMAVLVDQDTVYPRGVEERIVEEYGLLDRMIREGATGSVEMDGVKFIVETMGSYRVLLIDARSTLSVWELRRPMLLHLPLIFVALLLIVLGTNRFLTWLLAKRIMTSLNQLAEGARQIGEGNLDYRINYTRRDEFAPVCADFNEMASQLQQLMDYQRRNENSRKELLAGISHDLRTPLTSIKAYVEGLLDGVAEDLPAQLRYLGIIRNKAQDIDKLVDKLFIFSKLDIGEFPVNLELTDLGDELGHMVAAAQEDFGDRGLELELLPLAERVMVETDLVCLHNVFSNIIDNSLRYKVREGCRVRIQPVLLPGRVQLRITDDGPGVREDELDKLFDVFYRSDPSRQNPNKGSGLGLAISSRMMTRVGGGIRAENAPEGGLCMVLELPRYRGEEGRDEADSDH